MLRDARLFMTFAVGCLTGVLFTPAPAFAQYPATATYVCQTPTFWCAFVWSRGVPNGTTCYCSTYLGPVYGYTIDPSGVTNAPTLPKPQKPTDLDTPSSPAPSRAPDVASDDCYKGLGNCPGSFMRSHDQSDGQQTTRGVRSSRSSGSFADALRKLIDAASDEFNDVRGEARRGTSLSDTYAVTVVPRGFKRCALFIPHRTTRKPRVHCFSEKLRLREALDLVTDALGPRTEQDGDEYIWRLEGAEVSVENEDGEAGLSIRVR